MSSNGNGTDLIKIRLNKGGIELDINKDVNIALITHGLFLANMQVQEVTVMKEMEKASKEDSGIITADNIRKS